MARNAWLILGEQHSLVLHEILTTIVLMNCICFFIINKALPHWLLTPILWEEQNNDQELSEGQTKMWKQNLSSALLSPGPSLFSNSTLSPLGQWVGKFIQSLQALFPPVPYTYPLLHPEWTLPFPCLYTFPRLSQHSCLFLLPRMLPVHYRSQIPLAVNGIFPWPSTGWGSLSTFYMFCVPLGS